MKTPFFSAIVPLYNKKEYIKKSIDSVLNQTFRDFELIIVNDGSTDGSEKIISSIQDSRVRLINQKNGGVSNARNRGLKEAKGQYIAFLDADDEWLPKKLELFHDYLKKYEVDWAASAYYQTFFNGTRTVKYNKSGAIDNLIVEITKNIPIWTGTVVISKIFINKYRFKFSEVFKTSEDLQLWYKMACYTKDFLFINIPLSVYNHGDDASSLTLNTGLNGIINPMLILNSIQGDLQNLDETNRNRLERNLTGRYISRVFTNWIYKPDIIVKYKNDIVKYNSLPNWLLEELIRFRNLPSAVKKIIRKSYLLLLLY